MPPRTVKAQTLTTSVAKLTIQLLQIHFLDPHPVHFFPGRGKCPEDGREPAVRLVHHQLGVRPLPLANEAAQRRWPELAILEA